MSAQQTFIAYAKICSSSFACEYVKRTNYGEDMSDLMLKIRLLNSYISDLEAFYVVDTVNDFVLDDIKYLAGKEVHISKNNSLYLNSAVQVQIKSDDVNCLTEEQVCELTRRIKSLCGNCNC